MPTFILVQCVAMVVMAIANIAVGQIRIIINQERECRRLRLALRGELAEMSRLNAINSRNLRSKRPYILSFRACTAIYKANVGKLTTIADEEIALVVGAYAVNERIEHLVAATTKGNGPMAFKIVEGETPVDEIIEEIERSSEQIREALEVMNREESRAPRRIFLVRASPAPSLAPAFARIGGRRAGGMRQGRAPGSRRAACSPRGRA